MRRVRSSSFKLNPPPPIAHMEMASHSPSMLARAKPTLNSQKVTCRIFLTTFVRFYKLFLKFEWKTFSDELEKVKFRFLHAFFCLIFLVHHEKFKHDDVKIAITTHTHTHTKYPQRAAAKKGFLTHKILIDWNWNSCPLGGVKKANFYAKIHIPSEFLLIKYEFLAILFHFRNYYYNPRLLTLYSIGNCE